MQLQFDDSVADVELEPLRGHETFLVLTQVHVCVPSGGNSDVLHNLTARARLAKGARVFRLRRRRTLENLHAVGHALTECMANLRQPDDTP